MRIGFDAKRAFENSTGLGHYSRTLVKSLARNYPENEYILFTPRLTKLFATGTFPSIRTLTPGSFIGKLFKSWWRSIGIKKEIETASLDIYHGLSHEIPAGLTTTNVKTVVTMHDIIFEIYPHQYKAIDRKIYRKKFLYACKHADHIIAISGQTKNDLIAQYDADPEKISVCYQSCNEIYLQKLSAAQIDNIKTKYRLPEKYFLYVGSIIERKNLLLICKALALQKDPSRISLVVIGDGKSYKEKVKTYIKENRLQQQVIFLSEDAMANQEEGFKNSNDFPAIYQGATAFIYPSIYEGFGIPILEALFSGTPVITTNLSCMPETAGDAALYVGAEDAAGLADAMQRIEENKNLAEEMVAKGFKHAANFTQEKCAAAVIQVYNNLLYAD